MEQMSSNLSLLVWGPGWGLLVVPSKHFFILLLKPDAGCWSQCCVSQRCDSSIKIHQLHLHRRFMLNSNNEALMIYRHSKVVIAANKEFKTVDLNLKNSLNISVPNENEMTMPTV